MSQPALPIAPLRELRALLDDELDYWMGRRRSKTLDRIQKCRSFLFTTIRAVQDSEPLLFYFMFTDESPGKITSGDVEACFRVRDGVTKDQLAAKLRHVRELWAQMAQEAVAYLEANEVSK